MIIVNTENIDGKNLGMLNSVKGSTSRTKLERGAGRTNTSYTDMLNEDSEMATRSMTEKALAIGADAIVNVKYATISSMNNAAEVIAYGTAVKFI